MGSSRRISSALGVLLLVALAAGARAELPQRLEIEYELLRNGSRVAQIVGRFERNGNEYRLTESWRGRNLYALLGRSPAPPPEEEIDDASRRALEEVLRQEQE